MNWRLIPTQEVGDAWPIAALILGKAVECDEGRRTLHDILRTLVNGQSMLWLVSEPDEPQPNGWTHIGMPVGVVVTALHHYPHCRVMRIEWLAGERFDEWAHLISEIEGHAKQFECRSVEFAGRPGLARALKKHGFEIVGIEARKLV